jgi:hypothetical protein
LVASKLGPKPNPNSSLWSRFCNICFNCGVEIRSTDLSHDQETGQETYESILKYNIGEEWGRSNTRERDKSHERQGTGKTRREREWKTQEGKIPLLLRGPNVALTARAMQ